MTMTRDEVRMQVSTMIREGTRITFGIWRRPKVQRIVVAIQFVAAIARDEWWLLENPSGPAKTDEELMIEALTDELRARGCNGNSRTAAEELYKNGATKLGPARRHVHPPEARWAMRSPFNDREFDELQGAPKYAER
jgi:hypothetical protein